MPAESQVVIRVIPITDGISVKGTNHLKYADKLNQLYTSHGLDKAVNCYYECKYWQIFCMS
jgi:hypothetical protein